MDDLLRTVLVLLKRGFFLMIVRFRPVIPCSPSHVSARCVFVDNLKNDAICTVRGARTKTSPVPVLKLNGLWRSRRAWPSLYECYS